MTKGCKHCDKQDTGSHCFIATLETLLDDGKLEREGPLSMFERGYLPGKAGGGELGWISKPGLGGS